MGAASLSSTLATPSAANLAPATSHLDGVELPQARRAFAARLAIGATGQSPGPALQCWADIQGGEISGPRLRGVVQGGRIDWRTDAAGQSVEVTASFVVCSDDGRLLEVRDRGVYAQSSTASASAAICTSPEVVEPAGEPASPALLVGRLDLSAVAQGVARLLAFEVS